jgi:hypothetical protein
MQGRGGGVQGIEDGVLTSDADRAFQGKEAKMAN